MKIKRFVAPDMRQAMRNVREEQGSDAVILSTRRLPDGIEIIAAVDYDEALIREAARHGVVPVAEVPALIAPVAPVNPPAPAVESSPLSRLWRRAMPAPHGEALEADASAAASGSRAHGVLPPETSSVVAQDDAPTKRIDALEESPRDAAPSDIAAAMTAASFSHGPAASTPAPLITTVKPAHPEAAPSTPLHPMMEQAMQETIRMRAEMGSMRELLELQLSSLAWNDLERRQPLRARVLREMTRLGIDADVARKLADELPEKLSPEQARYLPLGLLTRSVRITDADQLAQGGVTALVGPTGVGKTTTIAKLAARAVMRHGVGEVALISTDHYRIGAAAQLEHYGRLLGVRVYPADDAESLREVLQMLRGKHTVLIDTAGVSGTDPRLASQMEILKQVADSEGSALRACMVLAANAQSQSLEEAMRAYLPLNLHSCILTKLDEAPSLGGALSVLVRHRLSLDYTTDGQRVPEDIADADARSLVLRAATALKNPAFVADDGLMAERFGLAVASA